MRHYTQLAQACDDDEQRRIFAELAAMEGGHKHEEIDPDTVYPVTAYEVDP